MIFLFVVIVIMALFGGGEKEFTLDKTKLLKAVLPYLIIIHHLWLLDDFDSVGVYVVSMFFFISGYGLQYKKNIGTVNILWLKHSICKLLIPLCVPSLFYIEMLLVKGWSYREIFSEIYNYRIILPYTWFVVTLIILYVIFFISANLVKANNIFLLFLFLFVCSISFLFFEVGFSTTYYQANLAFCGGCIYKVFERRIGKTKLLKFV